MTVPSDNHSIDLAAMISPQTTRADVRAGSREEAVEISGGLLVAAGKVHPGYVAAMKRVLQEMGPYAVIAPGIVLLHARPDDGVIEPCLSVMTLSAPVPFGHSENDPVSLVLALGAVDKESHIEALRQLAELLSDAATLQAIHSAKDGAALYAILARPKG